MNARADSGATDRNVAIVGAGPSGLSAALELARAGQQPLVLERTDRVGGLMRSIGWGDTVVDIGRKELYTRIPEVDDLWRTLLGGDSRPYPHRVGSLYKGHVVELSGAFRGMLRGVPPRLLARGAVSLAAGRLRRLGGAPSSYEAYWHGRVGEQFARLFAQGYWEKFRGVRWADMPPPRPGAAAESGSGGTFSQRAVAHALRPFRAGVPAVAAQGWRHPRLGTGQLFDRFHHAASQAGAEFRFSVSVDRIARRADGAWSLGLSSEEGRQTLTVRHLVSSLTIEALSSLLEGPSGPLLRRRATCPERPGRRIRRWPSRSPSAATDGPHRQRPPKRPPGRRRLETHRPRRRRRLQALRRRPCRRPCRQSLPIRFRTKRRRRAFRRMLEPTRPASTAQRQSGRPSDNGGSSTSSAVLSIERTSGSTAPPSIVVIIPGSEPRDQNGRRRRPERVHAAIFLTCKSSGCPKFKRRFPMSSGEILTLGKALIWFAVPLAIAGWELWRLNRPKR